MADEDLRVVKTRRAIEDAFLTLLHTMPFDTITVKLIVHEAKVNKATFYRHYRDKHDLATKTTDRVVREFRTEVMTGLAGTEGEPGAGSLSPSRVASILYGDIADLAVLQHLRIGGVDPRGQLQEVVTEVLLQNTSYERHPELDSVAWLIVRLALAYVDYSSEVDHPEPPHAYARSIKLAARYLLNWIPEDDGSLNPYVPRLRL